MQQYEQQFERCISSRYRSHLQRDTLAVSLDAGGAGRPSVADFAIPERSNSATAFRGA